jgi:hypothetical protein
VGSGIELVELNSNDTISTFCLLVTLMLQPVDRRVFFLEAQLRCDLSMPEQADRFSIYLVYGEMGWTDEDVIPNAWDSPTGSQRFFKG